MAVLRSPLLRRSLAAVAALAAAAALLVGLVLAWFYLTEGILQSLTGPDKSFMFWFLPFAFLAFCAIAIGGALALLARHLWKSDLPTQRT